MSFSTTGPGFPKVEQVDEEEEEGQNNSDVSPDLDWQAERPDRLRKFRRCRDHGQARAVVGMQSYREQCGKAGLG